MKFIKKAAALCFCAALALSVMAVSAMADDEAVLLGTVDNNTEFVVTLTKNDNGILNRDADGGDTAYEINATDTVTFDINLAYTGSTYSNKSINGFQFEFDESNSGGATVSAVTINNEEIEEASESGYENVYAYTASGDSDNDIAISSSATSIGTITFAFSSITSETPITPKIKDIQIQVRGIGNSQRPATTTGGTTTPANPGTDCPIAVNPTYTATVQKFEATSPAGLAGPKMVSGAIDKTEVTYYFTTGATLSAADAITGYTFKGWIVTADTDRSTTWADGSGNWGKNVYFGKTNDWTTDSASLVSVGASTPAERVNINFIPASEGIPTHMVGDITLTPVYTADSYAATFNAGTATASFGKDSNENDIGTANASGIEEYTASYTIEDLYSNNAVVDFLDLKRTDGKNKNLARKAYEFEGWVLSNVAATASGYVWEKDASSVHNATPAINDILTEATAKHYGNVTFTAVWKEVVYFAQVGYKYAGSGNSLILVGVPVTDDYEDGYTYQCNGNAMFIIDESASQRALYVEEAQTVKKANSNDLLNPDFTVENLSEDYVIYAYIAAESTTVADITINEGESGNDTLAYTGDIDGDGVSVSDFGNVDTLFIDNTNTSVYPISAPAGVKSRLLADYDTDDATATNFGSISDILAIYNEMGYSKS